MSNFLAGLFIFLGTGVILILCLILLMLYLTYGEVKYINGQLSDGAKARAEIGKCLAKVLDILKKRFVE